jgi:hypothetical protein
MHEQLRKFARRAAEIVGSAEVFLAAVIIIIILLWAALGPRFRYSELCALTGDFEKLRQRLAMYGPGPTARAHDQEGETEHR